MANVSPTSSSGNGTGNGLTPPFDAEFQCQLLSMMWNNPSFFLQAHVLLKPEWFGGEYKDPSGKPNPLEILFRLTVEIYRKHHVIPNALAFRQEINTRYQDPVRRENLHQWLEYIISLHVSMSEYIMDVCTKWVRRYIVYERFPQIIDAHNRQDTEAAEKLLDELHRERINANLRPPDRSNFFKELEKRQERRYLEQDSEFLRMRFPTGINPLDERLGNGLSRKEVGLILADTNVGKGVCLVNFGFHAAHADAHVLHITLEDALEDVEDRYETRFTHGALHMDEVAQNLMTPEVFTMLQRAYAGKRNNLVVTAMNGKWDRTIDDVEEEIYRCQADGFFPDVIILDYADILRPRKDPTGKTWEDVRSVYRDVKTLNSRHKIGVWTAAQATRGTSEARNVDPHHLITEKDISEGYDKLRTVDVCLSINQTLDEKDAGEFRFYLIKARNHKNRTIYKCTQDLSRMIFAFPPATVLKHERRGKGAKTVMPDGPVPPPAERVPDEVLKNAINPQEPPPQKPEEGK